MKPANLVGAFYLVGALGLPVGMANTAPGPGVAPVNAPMHPVFDLKRGYFLGGTSGGKWRKAAEEIDHPQLKQCYAERARDAAARARAFGAEEDDDQT